MGRRKPAFLRFLNRIVGPYVNIQQMENLRWTKPIAVSALALAAIGCTPRTVSEPTTLTTVLESSTSSTARALIATEQGTLRVGEWSASGEETVAGFSSVVAVDDGFVALDIQTGPFISGNGMQWQPMGSLDDVGPASFRHVTSLDGSPVIAGYVTIGPEDNDVGLWRWDDTQWNFIIDDSLTGPGYQNANSVAASDNLAVVVGVEQTDSTPSPVAWVSVDMNVWDLHQLPRGPDLLDAGVLDVTIAGSTAVAVGFVGLEAAFWQYDLESGWTTGIMPTLPADPNRHSHASAVVSSPEGFVAVGATDTNRAQMSLPAAWISADGQTWEPLPAPNTRSSSLSDIAISGNVLAASGSMNPGAGVGPVVWVATFGEDWQTIPVPDEIIPDEVQGQNRLAGIAISENTIVAVGDRGIWSAAYEIDQ